MSCYKKNNLTLIDDSEIVENLKGIQNALSSGKDTLAKMASSETGKPIKYALAEVQRAIKIIDNGVACLLMIKQESGTLFNRQLIARWYRIKLPIGLVIGFTPFSSPFSSFVHKLVASLIYRNNFICKPSPKALRCSLLLYSIIRNACTSDTIRHAFTVLHTNDNSLASDFLLNAEYDCLLFTGKSITAAEIKKVIGRKRAVFETGSSAMAYIGKTADINKAVTNVVSGAFSQSGMRCVATKNVFINKEIMNCFLDLLNKKMKKIICGKELNLNTDVGPILDEDTLKWLVDYISILKNNKYDVVFGGSLKEENILEPTILLDQGSNIPSIKEAYGPILCLHVVDDLLSISDIYFKRSSINASIYTNDLDETKKWIKCCNTSGAIYINHGPTERIDELPFGGFCDQNEGKEGLLELMSVLSKDQIIFECS